MSFDNHTKLISRMTSCWNFFVDEYSEYVSENVFTSKLVRVNPIRRKDRKQYFNDDDLGLIFNHKIFLHAIFKNVTGRTQSCKLCSYLYNRIVFSFSFHHLPKSPSTNWSDIKIEGDGNDLK